jgi:hypothetical protein
MARDPLELLLDVTAKGGRDFHMMAAEIELHEAFSFC